MSRAVAKSAGEGLDLVDLSEVAWSCLEAIAPPPSHLEVESDLATDLPFVLADPGRLEEWVSRLLARGAEVVGRDWGAVTVGTGVLGIGRTPLARAELWTPFAERHHVFLEVHTTGPSIGPLSCGYVTRPFEARGFGPLDLAKARAGMAEYDGEVLVDPLATAGCAVVLLLPYAAADLPALS